jgi:DNA gyrase subunit A
LTRIAAELLADTDPADGSTEAGVLGAAVPNLIINGSANCPPSQVINIPPHNLREVVRAATFLIDHPDATASDLVALIPGPDFPTGAIIYGTNGITEYLETGHGRLTVRARATIESDEVSNTSHIVVTEIPYWVTVPAVEIGIAEAVRDQRLNGITDLRNESSNDGMRIVVTLKRDVSPGPLLQQLCERTAMQTILEVRMAALVPEPETGALLPRVLPMKELLEHFIAHRYAVIARRAGADFHSKEQRVRLIKEDLTRIADVYGDDRRTEIRAAVVQ